MCDHLLLYLQQLPLKAVLQKHFPLSKVPRLMQKVCLQGWVLRNAFRFHGVPPHCSLAITCLLHVWVSSQPTAGHLLHVDQAEYWQPTAVRPWHAAVSRMLGEQGVPPHTGCTSTRLDLCLEPGVPHCTALQELHVDQVQYWQPTAARPRHSVVSCVFGGQRVLPHAGCTITCLDLCLKPGFPHCTALHDDQEDHGLVWQFFGEQLRRRRQRLIQNGSVSVINSIMMKIWIKAVI